MITISRSSNMPYYFLNGDVDERTKKAIKKECSFWVQGAERSEKFKRGLWDGFECLVYQTKKDKTLFFPVGLLDKVESVLNAFGIPFEIEEVPPQEYESLNLSWKSDKRLYDYQEEAYHKAIVSGSGVISLPTGSGKTEICLKIMEKYNIPVLIVVDSKILLYQWVDRIRDTFGTNHVGVVGDNKKDFQPITVAITDSLYSMIMNKTLREIDYPVLVVDECHHIAAATVYTIALRCNARHRFGLSATPRREDGAEMKIWAATGPICANITPVDLIKRGILAKPRFRFEWLAASRSRGRTWQESYDEYITANAERNEKISEMVSEYVNAGDIVYVHVSRIDHGKLLSNITGYPFLQGKDKTEKRNYVIERFKSGEVPCLISTLLGEGFDVPPASVFINAASGKSSVMLIQRVGRVLRATKDKTEATICDFIEGGRYFSQWWKQRYQTYAETYGEYCPR